MKRTYFSITLPLITALFFFTACKTEEEKTEKKQEPRIQTVSNVNIVSAMKNVMKEGKLEPNIKLDTIAIKENLYGIGPLSYLQGEVMIMNGESFVSTITPESSIKVEKTYDASAPFFVYTNVKEWQKSKLPESITKPQQLQEYLSQKTKELKKPFAFKLEGSIKNAKIHVQNLPEGTEVNSPKEAHQGQVDFELKNEFAYILGFFSTEHQGVFTHLDTFLHMHLLTRDNDKMGHLDEVEFGEMYLYLPKD